MNILVVAAMENEILPFIEGKHPQEVLLTGVGVAPAVYHLSKKLYHNKYDMVIQAGVAGSFNDFLLPAEVVVVESDCFADSGIREKGAFTPLFETALADANSFPFNKGRLINSHAILGNTALKKVSAVTVNTITDDSEQIDEIVRIFSPEIESMEGAALHYVCMMEGVPFVQLRSISNKVGERNKELWKLDEAILNLNEQLVRIIRSLNN